MSEVEELEKELESAEIRITELEDEFIKCLCNHSILSKPCKMCKDTGWTTRKKLIEVLNA